MGFHSRNVFAAGFWDLLSPPRCVACDDPQPADPPFCMACSPLIEPAERGLLPPAPSAALFMYGGPLSVALQRLKYEGRTELAVPLGGLLADCADAYAGLVDRLIPIPLFSAKLRRRGYNQTALLARPLARSLGLRCDVTSLLRIRPSAPLAGMERARRLASVRGAFRCSRPVRDRVLLVDDVRTTGATLAEAALALQVAGAVKVYTLALAFAQS